MAKINSLNNKSSELTIDPGASGDSFLQFSINTTGEFRIGVDDDAGDAFKISQGSALGSNDTFIMTAAGERTLPLNPCFLAYLGSDDNNVTGNGTAYTVGTNVALTEVFDQNGDFNTNGTFTAPVTGRYLFSYSIYYNNMTSAATTINSRIVASNRGAQLVVDPNGVTFQGTSMNVILDMDASDTCTFVARVSGEAGDVVDLPGAGGTLYNTHMSGCLIS